MRAFAIDTACARPTFVGRGASNMVATATPPAWCAAKAAHQPTKLRQTSVNRSAVGIFLWHVLAIYVVSMISLLVVISLLVGSILLPRGVAS
jgi:hypothetical protein